MAPLLPRLQRSPWARAFLDGVNVVALGLMAAVTLRLGRDAIVDVPTAVAACVAAFVLVRYRPNSAWLIGAGGLLGILYKGTVG
jgi:chromate transporter